MSAFRPSGDGARNAAPSYATLYVGFPPLSDTVTTSRPSGPATRSSFATTGSARSNKLKIKAVFFIMSKDTNKY